MSDSGATTSEHTRGHLERNHLRCGSPRSHFRTQAPADRDPPDHAPDRNACPDGNQALRSRPSHPRSRRIAPRIPTQRSSRNRPCYRLRRSRGRKTLPSRSHQTALPLPAMESQSRDSRASFRLLSAGASSPPRFEGRERYPVRVRYLRERRDSIEELGEILIACARW